MILRKEITKNSSEKLLDLKETQARNERQTVFRLVRELVQAQFEYADKELTTRLWQDISDREIDIERIINLMYQCSFHHDDFEMTRVDEDYQNKKYNY